MHHHRILATGILFAALSWAASGFAQPRFAAEQTLELPREVTIDLDGAGGARVSWRGDVIARVELLLQGGSDAAASLALDVAGGARLPRADLLDVALSEGQAGGGRGIDDDADGRTDEDPFDGVDNDGDGRRDEDFAAIGHEMHVSLAALDGAGLPGASLRGRWSYWPYFHVDDVLFWDASLEVEGPVQGGAPAVRILGPYDIDVVTETIEPHVTLGRARARQVRFLSLRADGVDGRRLYLALVRLDGETGDILPGQDGIVWETKSEVRWPLAIVTAPTRDALEFSVAQALLTYRASPSEPAAWTVPPLCARCQQTRSLRAQMRLEREGADLELTLRTEGHDGHLRISAEGASVAGVPLASYLTRANAARAEYRLPVESLDGQEIVAAALAQDPALSLLLHNGLTVSPDDVDLVVGPDVGSAVVESEDEPDVPGHLAPHLLQTWPNPFQETTTIRFEVPSTLGDAFDFEPDDERVQRLDLQAPPPFGPNPVVRVRVYNVGGQLIRVLDESVRRVGHHSVSWDGGDDQGMPVAAGAYYINVEMGDYHVTRRVLRLKP